VLTHLRRHGAALDIGTAAFLGMQAHVLGMLDDDPAALNRPPEYVTYYPPSGSPLRNAATGGHLALVKRLLERGADPNLPEERIAPRGHALYSAVYRGHVEIARLLLEYGAFPNPPVESSADALSIAINRGDAPMVELLASYGAARAVDILAYYGDLTTAAAVFDADRARANDPDALTNAAQQGHESFVRLLLRCAPALATRVGTAASTRALTELLFAHGMDPSHADWLGITPLHRFARDGQLEMAALFLDHGADVHARDDELCSTPLAWAARHGRLEMVELLLAHGAAIEHPDDPAWATPLAWASRRGQLAVAARLAGLGAAGPDPAASHPADGVD
jgi:ankyrin repeat protein